MTTEQYFEKAKFIWKNYVPKQGQSEFVQGELLRAVEKLRDEAQRNGNINWDHGHLILANYIKDTLTNSGCFDLRKNEEIESDINRLMDYDHPYVEDDIYDRLCDRVVDFFIQNPEPIKNPYNENLFR
ncbi:MAG: hypothetical protein KDD41_04085 [Flavobacteriales bacterium]|nr:hypothetical protein [Flavobacteriales bacterium]